MKKISIFIACIILSVSLAACSESSEDSTGRPAVISRHDIDYVFNAGSNPRIVRTGAYYYYISSADACLYRCSPDGSDPVLIQQGGASDSIKYLMTDGTKVYYLLNDLLHYYDPDLQKSTKAGDDRFYMPFLSNGSVYSMTAEKSSVIKRYDTDGKLTEEIRLENTDRLSSYFVLGNEIFYLGESRSDPKISAFYSYNTQTKQTETIYSDMLNALEYIAADEEYYYLQFQEKDNPEKGVVMKVIDRENKQTVQTFSGSFRYFLVIESEIYAVSQEGLVKAASDGGKDTVISADPRAEIGINIADGKIFLFDMRYDFDILIEPDGSGRTEFQK